MKTMKLVPFVEMVDGDHEDQRPVYVNREKVAILYQVDRVATAAPESTRIWFDDDLVVDVIGLVDEVARQLEGRRDPSPEEELAQALGDPSLVEELASTSISSSVQLHAVAGVVQMALTGSTPEEILARFVILPRASR